MNNIISLVNREFTIEILKLLIFTLIVHRSHSIFVRMNTLVRFYDNVIIMFSLMELCWTHLCEWEMLVYIYIYIYWVYIGYTQDGSKPYSMVLAHEAQPNTTH